MAVYGMTAVLFRIDELQLFVLNVQKVLVTLLILRWPEMATVESNV